jgi:hypothetical protein
MEDASCSSLLTTRVETGNEMVGPIIRRWEDYLFALHEFRVAAAKESFPTDGVKLLSAAPCRLPEEAKGTHGVVHHVRR